MTYIRASEIGCALDCDLRNGRNKYKGGPATDDGPRINAAMAGASADNPLTLIIDGSALISGLFLPAGGHWGIAGLGCGTGFFVKKGTNNDGIHNGAPNAPSSVNPRSPTPLRGANVSLSNFTLNGNEGDGHNGDSTSGLRQGNDSVWYCGIRLMNLDNIVIEKVVVVEVPSFHFQFDNVGKVTVNGCVMKSYGPSTDGLHFDGPANDVTITNCTFTTGDDAIALNCPEGYAGNISRVAVSNCSFNSLSLMRLYTTNGSWANYFIDTVSVSNCNGTLSEAAFLIGTNPGNSPNSVLSLTVSDCNLTGPAVLAVAQNFGDITLNNVAFVPSQANVGWPPPMQANHASAFLRPSPLYGNMASTGSSLILNNCTIQRKSSVDVAAVILEYDSTIGTLEFNGFAVQDGGSVSDLLTIGSESIGELILNSVDSSNIKAPISTSGFSNIGSVAGKGVLATGWEFPDSIMANGVPYISANSGQPSIKIGGVVEPYGGA
jgi:hypothetical protein